MKTLNLLLMAACLSANPLLAAVGIYETYAVLNVNNGGNVFYDAGANTGNPDYQGANLGSFIISANSLLLKGGEVKSWKNSGGDVTGAYLYYRVWTGSASGNYNQINLPWNSDLGGGNQKWQNQNASVNLLSGLNNGNYTLELYFKITSNEGDKFDNRSGNNYTATFSVVPEPTQIALAVFGGIAALGSCAQWLRKRRARILS